MGKRMGLMPQKTAGELVEMYYLEARSHLLETAAILDRIERGSGSNSAMEDEKIKNLFKMCGILTKEKTDRAEKILNMLSI